MSVPFTRLGVFLIVLGATALIFGIWLRWAELITAGAACGVGLLVALPYVVRRPRFELKREVGSTRVTASPAERRTPVVVEVRAHGRRSGNLIVEDVVSHPEEPNAILQFEDVSPLSPQERTYSVPTDRRGVIDLGPARVTRRDPLGLYNRDVRLQDSDRIWVHPRHLMLAPPSSGFATDVDGPTFDTSPAGDIAFHSIREYAAGDNFRHVHWPSTAKQVDGTLMVRHYVDNRRPVVGVLVDDELNRIGESEFEIALEIAASIGASAIDDAGEGAVYVGGRCLWGSEHEATPRDLLDRLAELEGRRSDVPASLEQQAASVLDEELEMTLLVVVAGPSGAAKLSEDLMAMSGPRRILVVSVTPEDPSLRTGGGWLTAASLEHFDVQWESLL